MSDLISTPSQTQSPVSNEAFEVLIDLLASDGIDEPPSKFQGHPRLRDPSGKLDYDKIRSMFATHRFHQDGDSDDELQSYQSTSSTVPSRPQSPKPVQRPAGGHRRSSTFGNQPPIHENPTKVEDVAPRQPLSFDELNTALAGAQDEVRSLRQQYDQLCNLVAKRFGTDVTAKPCPSTTAPDKEGVPPEIANLSENEAKRALTALARSLNLSLSAISSSTLPPQLPVNSTRQHDVASIARALKFLGTVDELVWRRTSAPPGPRPLLPLFSEENIVALIARLELWERAVRRSSRF